MPLCELLHKSIVASGGDKNGAICEICQIVNQNVLNTGIIARIIPEQKQKEWVRSDGTIRPDCFSPNKKCLFKISCIDKNSEFETSVNTFKDFTGYKLYGFAELDIEQINTECPFLKIIKDNYAYHGSNFLDFKNHCSLMSFGGKNLKELNTELKHKVNLAKMSVLKKF